ncbi:MAG: relaxase domain-containing protein [Solirubrobacteraceae bacterium]
MIARLDLSAARRANSENPVRLRRGHRRGGARRRRGLIAAAHRHRMGRALDPPAYPRVCAYATRVPDGRRTALHGTLLYEHAKTAGMLYQSHLGAEVRDQSARA